MTMNTEKIADLNGHAQAETAKDLNGVASSDATQLQNGESKLTNGHSEFAPSNDTDMAEGNPKAKDDTKDAKSKAKAKPIVRYDEYWDMHSFSWKLRKSAKPGKKKEKESLLVVRRRMDHKGRHIETAVDIYSPHLVDALNEINSDVQKTKLKQSPPTADLQLLYHSLEELERCLAKERAKESPDEEALEHLKTLVDFIREEHGSTISTLSSLFAANEISWELLWALFKPNSLVHHFHELTEQNLVLLARWCDTEKRCDGRYFRLACDLINNNGISFGYATKIFEIKEYEGTSRIQDLTVHPMSYHENPDGIIKHARARAQRFVKMQGSHQYMDISGSAMREIRSANRHEPRNIRFFSFGKMIVDPKSFHLFEPDAEYNLKVYQALDKDKLNETQLAVCSPIVFGYCFGVKQWGGFALDRCQDVVWQNDAFEQLVLEQNRKQMVYSLVRQHKKRKEAFDDVVEGKGKGLIGLLSGKPGSGKTLTAESISQLTKQPLYTVSAGELGEKPGEVDEKLTKILALAVTWDAVVLLDEADVFLQTRDDNNITRNALVSIFLRQLEYFEGILILTTNRIGNIDPAFESRIHFSFHYPDLDFKARKQIWQMFWKRAGSESNVVNLSNEDLEKLAQRPLNGRQIKNTVASALSLALEEGQVLDKKHADTVLTVVETWESAVAQQDRP